MKYTVVWVPAALMELATAWNDAGDRGEVAAASDEIDRQLAAARAIGGRVTRREPLDPVCGSARYRL